MPLSNNKNGSAATGVAAGESLLLMEQLAESRLPQSMGYEWTGMSFRRSESAHRLCTCCALGVLMVYLVLRRVEYESWLMPAAVIMVVPLALLGTVVAVAVRGIDSNLYTQIGIVLIVGNRSRTRF